MLCAAGALRLSGRGLVVFALVIAAVWTITGLLLREAYFDGVDGALVGAANLARSLAEYQASSVRAIDLSLIHLREEWLRAPTLFDKAVQRQSEHLARERVIQVAVLDADGTMMFSGLPADKRMNFSDREYFRAQRDGGSDRLHISAPVFGRVTKQWAIQFTRPIFQEGSFAGVIIVAVPPPALELAYRDIDLGAQGVITLVRSDGQILARSLDLARGLGVSLAGHRSMDPSQPPAGHFLGTGLVDGVLRFVSYRRLDSYPLTVMVGQSKRSVLASYRAQRDTLIGAAAIMSFLLYALLRLFESRARDRESRERFRVAALEVERKLLEEREQVMLELHDGSLQSLYAVSVQIEHCRRLIERDPVAAARIASRVQPYLSRIIQDIRGLLSGDTPAGRSPRLFVDELSRLVAATSETGPTFSLDIEPKAVDALSAEQAAHVLRIAAEAASNVVRHAKATRASVSLALHDPFIRLAIADDGSGLPQDYAARGFGVKNMRMRAGKLGGELRVDAGRDGGGTQISVDFPRAQG